MTAPRPDWRRIVLELVDVFGPMLVLAVVAAALAVAWTVTP